MTYAARLSVPVVLFLCLGAVGAAAGNKAPLIQHTPVQVAAQGQSIAIKAVVKDNDGSVRSVVLFYSTSRDVAPFRINMQSAGRNAYVCSIPANLLGRAREVVYYIEATDDAEAAAETPWHTVSIELPEPGSGSPVESGIEPEVEKESHPWKTALIVGAGAVAAGGAGVLVADWLDKKDDDESEPAEDLTGRYVGSVSTSLEFPGDDTIYDVHGATIVINADGSITSDDLYEGEDLRGALSGSSFSLVANVADTNLTGVVTYSGSVQGGRISGSVGGTVQSTIDQVGTYFGTFYAIRQ